jgi:PAS domain S-box-containing protein
MRSPLPAAAIADAAPTGGVPEVHREARVTLTETAISLPTSDRDRRASRLLLLVALLCAGLVAATLLARDQLRERTSVELDISSRQGLIALAHRYDDMLRSVQANLALLAALPAVAGADPAGCGRLLESDMPGHPLLANLLLVDAGGKTLCRAREASERQGPEAEGWIGRALAGAGNTLFLSGAGARALWVAHPLADPTGRRTLILLAELDIDEIAQTLAPRMLPKKSTLALVDQDGVALQLYPAAGIGVRWADLVSIAAGRMKATPTPFAMDTPIQDARWQLHGVTLAGGDGAWLVTALPLEAALDAATAGYARSLTWVGGTAVIMLLFFWVVTTQLLSPGNDPVQQAARRQQSEGAGSPARATSLQVQGSRAEGFEAMVEACSVGLFRADKAGNCLYASQGWTDITGRPPAGALGQGWRRAIHPQDRDRVVAELQTALERRARASIEFRLLRADGSPAWVIGNLVPDPCGNGDTIGTLTEITAKVNAEKALHDRESFVESIADLSAVALLRLDENLHAWYVNARWARLTGIDATRSGTGWSDALVESHRIRVLGGLRAALEQGTRTRIEFQISSADGSPRWMLGEFQPMEGGQRGLVGALTDISERIEAENRLRDSEARFRTLTELSNDFYWEQDEQLRFTFVSATATGRYVVPPLESIGKTRFELDLDWPSAEALEQHRADTAARRPFRDLVLRSRRSGRYVQVSGEPVFGHDGRFRGYRGAGRDVSERLQVESALRESEARYRDLFAANPLPMWVYDPETLRFLLVNDAAVAHYGYSRDEFLAMTLFDIRPQDDAHALRETLRAVAGGASASGIWRHLKKDGTLIRVETMSRDIALDGKRGRFVLANDISERLRAQSEREESRAKLAAIIGSAMDAVISIDEEQHIVLFNRAAETMFGLTAEEAIGRNLEMLIPARFRHMHASHVREFGTTSVTTRRMGRLATVHGLRADGTEFPMEASISHSLIDNQRIYTVILRDITERLAAAEALRQAHERMQLLSRKVLEVQEQERRHIARELHDETGQMLTAIKLKLHGAGKHADRSLAAQRVEEAVKLTGEVLDQVKGLSLELRPPQLDDLGLESAIRWNLDRRVSGAGVAGHLESNLNRRRFSTAVETACFRIAQEAMTNCIRHAAARNVWVSLHYDGRGIGLTVRDDGTGLDVAAMRLRALRGHSMGILGMEERATLVGGRFEISSVADGGTRVSAWFPSTESDAMAGTTDDGLTLDARPFQTTGQA